MKNETSKDNGQEIFEEIFSRYIKCLEYAEKAEKAYRYLRMIEGIEDEE